MNLKLPLCMIGLVSASFLAGPVVAANKYDTAVGEVMAAVIIAKDCKGLERLAGPDTQKFVIAASKIAAQKKGIREQKMRRLLFYSKSAQLAAVGNQTLSQYDQSTKNTKAMCGFGKKVAGTDHPIGRYLVRG